MMVLYRRVLELLPEHCRLLHLCQFMSKMVIEQKGIKFE